MRNTGKDRRHQMSDNHKMLKDRSTMERRERRRKIEEDRCKSWQGGEDEA